MDEFHPLWMQMDVCVWNSFMMMLTMMLVNVGVYDINFFNDEFHREWHRAYFDIIDGIFSHLPWHSINVSNNET
jgi:hypothetical protein